MVGTPGYSWGVRSTGNNLGSHLASEVGWGGGQGCGTKLLTSGRLCGPGVGSHPSTLKLVPESFEVHFLLCLKSINGFQLILGCCRSLP